MSDIYNEEYYNNYGTETTSYLEDERIGNTLEELVDFTCANLQFQTHLDIGCAMGFTVRAMTRRGKDSRGVDISEYAIAHALPEVKDLLRVHDIRRSVGLYKYDLVTCIEVVEHIDKQYTERVIQNICNASSRYIFFSSKFDLKEKTHVNVRPTGHWFGLFEQRGFKYIPMIYDPIHWGFFIERV